MTVGAKMIVDGRGRILKRHLKAIGFSLALLVAPHFGATAALAAAGTAVAPAPVAAASMPAAPAAAGDPAGPDKAVRAPDVAGVPASTVAGNQKLPQASTYVRRAPVEGIGMPVPGGMGMQTQFSPLGHYAKWFHNAILMPVIAAITLFVLFLLIWVVARFNHRSNPVASRTSHNTTIEVIWTLLPVLILVGIAVPSIDLLAKQFKPAPAQALTVKATGNQWFWTYTYPDNGGFEVTSYMLNLPNSPTINNGVRMVGSDRSDGPAHLEVDNRLVLPVGEPIRMQITGADVIHSFAVPSLYFKLDGIPGRINEKVLFIEKPGVYYGQCSELCGAKHAYMPIAVEALPRPQYNAWVLSQSGGVIDGKKPLGAAVDAPAAAAGPTSVPAVAAKPGAGTDLKAGAPAVPMPGAARAAPASVSAKPSA